VVAVSVVCCFLGHGSEKQERNKRGRIGDSAREGEELRGSAPRGK